MNIVFTTVPVSPEPIISWEDDYTAPWRDEALIEALGDRAWDGPVVRLARYEPRRGRRRARMVLQRARYFDYIGTNLSPQPCERTDAIGIAALLFTADRRCILQQRSPTLAIRPGEIGPSMSGTLEPMDLDGARYLSQINARREIREELGVTDVEIAHLHLMGLIREPQRSGAPELMYRGTLRLTAAELQQRPHPEGALLFIDIMQVYTLENRAVPVDNLMNLLVREDMGR